MKETKKGILCTGIIIFSFDNEWSRNGRCYHEVGTSLVAQTIKRLSAMQESQVQSLGWADPLEKEMAAHSRILVWEIPWTEEPGGL